MHQFLKKNQKKKANELDLSILPRFEWKMKYCYRVKKVLLPFSGITEKKKFNKANLKKNWK